MNGLQVDLPYPFTQQFTQDPVAARLLAPAYASLHGELTALLSYIYHSFYFEKCNRAELAKTASSIAICEMQHFRLLGQAILALGTDPVFTQSFTFPQWNYRTAAISYSKNPQQILLDEIAGEMQAISTYEEMLCKLKNQQVSALISRILLDEQLHLSTLKDCYTRLQNERA